VLSEKFQNSRNIQAAIIAEKKVDESIQKAIDEGACVFFLSHYLKTGLATTPKF
jgi:DNA ligase (NAD+)